MTDLDPLVKFLAAIEGKVIIGMGEAEDITRALLAAGWSYPSDATCYRCECLVDQHDAGGYSACRECSLPHGGC